MMMGLVYLCKRDTDFIFFSNCLLKFEKQFFCHWDDLIFIFGGEGKGDNLIAWRRFNRFLSHFSSAGCVPKAAEIGGVINTPSPLIVPPSPHTHTPPPLKWFCVLGWEEGCKVVEQMRATYTGMGGKGEEDDDDDEEPNFFSSSFFPPFVFNAGDYRRDGLK